MREIFKKCLPYIGGLLYSSLVISILLCIWVSLFFLKVLVTIILLIFVLGYLNKNII